MSRDYGRISTAFWNSADVRPLSDRGKLLASYLLTSPHSNIIGAFLLPDAYVSEDLGWSLEAVSRAFGELFRKGFCERFSDGRHLVICKYLEWNPIENENVGKAALKQLAQLPKDQAIRHVLDGLKLYSKHFPNGLGTVSEPFRNIEPYPEPEPKPKIEPEPKQDLARSAGADEMAVALRAYRDVAEEFGWPVVRHLTNSRKEKLRARLRECGGVDGWLAAMAKARASPFLRGENGRDKTHEKWVPDFDFFLQQSSFTRLMEGKYDDRDSNSEPTGFAAAVAGARAAVN